MIETQKNEPQAHAEFLIERLWAEEALRRDAELDAGTASMRDAEDVFKDLRARIMNEQSSF